MPCGDPVFIVASGGIFKGAIKILKISLHVLQEKDSVGAIINNCQHKIVKSYVYQIVTLSIAAVSLV